LGCRDVSSIHLRSVQRDLLYAALYDRRKQLEEMCDDGSVRCEPEDSKQSEETDSPGQKANDVVSNYQLSRLRREMNRAIHREDYERAAELRDEIK